MKLIAAAIILLSSFALAACGGDTAATPTLATSPTNTATAVQPTNTSAPLDTPTSAPTATETPVPATDTPLPPTETPIPPTATAAAASVEVTESTFYSSSIGVRVVGMLKNTGAAPVEGVQIAVEGVGADGSTVASGQDILIGGAVIQPGESWPFLAILDQATGDVISTTIQAQASPYDPNGFRVGPPATLTVGDLTIGKASQYFGPDVAGKVTNGGAAPATGVSIAVAGFDEAGHIGDANITFIHLDPLAAGASAPFSTGFARTDVAIKSAKGWAHGYEKK